MFRCGAAFVWGTLAKHSTHSKGQPGNQEKDVRSSTGDTNVEWNPEGSSL